MDTRIEVAKLIELASEMVRCKSMPSIYFDDWQWGKINESSWNKVFRAAFKAEKQCKDWAVSLSDIVSKLNHKDSADLCACNEEGCNCSFKGTLRGLCAIKHDG